MGSPGRSRLRAALWAGALLLTGCGASLSQVAADQPHGVVVLEFEHKDPDYAYEHQVSIDGAPAVAVKGGEHIRLSLGTHTLMLVAIAYAYTPGEQQVTENTCEGYGDCRQKSYRTVTRPGVVMVEKDRCMEEATLHLSAGSEARVLLSIFRDLTCTVSPSAL